MPTTLKRTSILAVNCCLIFAAPVWGDGCDRQSGPTARVTPEAVWKPSPGKIPEIKKLCEPRVESERLGCFVDAMRTAGASPEALAFTISLGEDPGYLYRFRLAGPVDLAYVTRPLHEKYFNQLFAVNGSVPLFDIDSPNLLNDIAQDAAAKNLFPPGSTERLVPGWRMLNFPLSRPRADGGVELVVDYAELLSDAHAMLFARLRFDQGGNFLSAFAQNVSSTDFRNGAQANAQFHYKVGDFFLLTSDAFAGDSPLVTVGDISVVRELDHAAMSGFCASVCVTEYLWTFEAVGKGETNIVFSTGNESKVQGTLFQRPPYRVHVD